MISILLATYNGEEYIKKCIDSIINQTFKDWELLIGLNGTTDSTKEILKSYSDKRIKIYDFGDDKGKAKTLNKLLTLAKYDIIATQDDDDVWYPNKLEEQMPFIEHYDVVGTNSIYINEKDEVTNSIKVAEQNEIIKIYCKAGNNQMISCSALITKSACLDVGGWNEDIPGLIDYDFWLRLIKANKQFYNVQKYLVAHRLHEKSKFNTKQFDIKSLLRTYGY